MKKILLIVFVFAMNLWILPDLQAQVIVKVRPRKPDVVIVKTPAPGANYIWIEGHWKWSRRQHQYVWVNGHWEKRRHHKVWVPGHWAVVPGGYRWVPGHWRRI